MYSVHTIQQLLLAARYAGSDVTLTQGGGGNVSVKSSDGKIMFIKASGYTLNEVSPEGGFVETDRYAAVSALRDLDRSDKSRSAIQDEFSTLLGKAAITDQLRPSIEAGFHAILPGVVIHTHPVYINAFLCMKDGVNLLKTICDCNHPVVDYYPPGYELALMVDKEYGKLNTKSGGIYLLNHGFVSWAETAEDAARLMDNVETSAKIYLGELKPKGHEPSIKTDEITSMIRNTGFTGSLHVSSEGFVTEAAFDNDLAAAVLNPLVPDDAVYNYGRIFTTDGKTLPDLPEKFILIVKNQGIIIGAPTGRTIKNMEETLTAHIMVRRLINGRGVPVELPQEEIDFITGMESEKFRSALK
ncbi:MAG: class II aldolase/adducin family protein [Firmicutes bacterium]|nr:class II aldolase/adducin family protein [Bacillota bacterium]